MGSQIMKLLLQLCLFAVVCYQASAQTTTESPTTTEAMTTEATTTEMTTTTATTTTSFVCPIEKAKCDVGEGRCNKNSKCKGKLSCGFRNCQKFHPCAAKSDRCCEEDPGICDGEPKDRNCCTKENQCRGKLVCGKRNCRDFHPNAKPWANCCI